MKKKLKFVVSYDKTEMTEEKKKQQVAQFFVLLAKWKTNEITKNNSRNEQK